MDDLHLSVDQKEEKANSTTNRDDDAPNTGSIAPATVQLPSMDFGSELDDFIAAYGGGEVEDGSHDEEPYTATDDTTDNEFDSLLEEHTKAMENEMQRQIDDQIQQALQDQLDEQMEDYLRHLEPETDDYYDNYYDTTNNDDVITNQLPSDPSLSFLSQRLAKAVRLEASVPTVAEINADIQKIVEKYQQGQKDYVQQRQEQQQGGSKSNNKRTHD